MTTASEQGYFTIGFDAEAGETAEAIIDRCRTYCVQITTADGNIADYELVGTGEWDGQNGHPVRAKRWSDNLGCGVDPVLELDAIHILIH